MELKLLRYAFDKRCENEKGLTIVQFYLYNSAHYEIDVSEHQTPAGNLLLSKLFEIMDSHGDGVIDFRDYVMFMSAALRGTFDEKFKCMNFYQLFT